MQKQISELTDRELMVALTETANQQAFYKSQMDALQAEFDKRVKEESEKIKAEQNVDNGAND